MIRFDLEFFLVAGVFLTGAILFFSLGGENKRNNPWYYEYSKSFFPILLIVLLLRTFVMEPFRIPSGSMLPTLISGDFILVNKFVYGLRIPITHKKIFENQTPARGDVVVFHFPNDPKVDYIKRVVGLPGDNIMYKNKILYINGKAMHQEMINHFSDPYAEDNSRHIIAGYEKLANVKHQILVDLQMPIMNTGEISVPPKHYFVMGDNRDHSSDSRFWGFVPERYLVGQAFLVWMHWNATKFNVRFDRIGKDII